LNMTTLVYSQSGGAGLVGAGPGMISPSIIVVSLFPSSCIIMVPGGSMGGMKELTLGELGGGACGIGIDGGVLGGVNGEASMSCVQLPSASSLGDVVHSGWQQGAQCATLHQPRLGWHVHTETLE